MFVTLEKVQYQIQPKEYFNNLVKYLKEYYSSWWMKCRIKYGCDARIAYQEKNEYVEYGLPLAVLINNNSFFETLFIFLVFDLLNH